MERTKYNVDKNLAKRTWNSIVFDSQMEMRYYRDVLLPKVESGEVVNYELQKKYILQDGFERNGKKVLPVTYVADFFVQYKDGREEVIDTKGMPDNVAKIKRKLFWYRYPDIDYIWMSYVKKFGGWGLYDDFKKLRNERRSVKNADTYQKEDATSGQG